MPALIALVDFYQHLSNVTLLVAGHCQRDLQRQHAALLERRHEVIVRRPISGTTDLAHPFDATVAALADIVESAASYTGGC